MANNTGRIGVLAESAQHIGEITRLVRGAGFIVAATYQVSDTSMQAGNALPKLPDADIWVVNLDLDTDSAMAILELLDAQNKHVIFDHDRHAVAPAVEGEKPLLPAVIRKKREKRLALKLRQWVIPEAVDERKRARDVWVLAASTGGPDAVIRFLKGIPAELKGIALIYAQHIEPSGLEHLSKAVARHCSWRVCTVNQAYSIREQTLYIVCPERQIDLQDGGTLSSLSMPWAGQFSPSLNQVIAKVARVYGARGGVLVFTGMGDDGANSCTMLRHRGGQVWIQSPETCAVDSMPLSVEATGCVQFRAPPEQLAEQFVKFTKFGIAPEP